MKIVVVCSYTKTNIPYGKKLVVKNFGKKAATKEWQKTANVDLHRQSPIID